LKEDLIKSFLKEEINIIRKTFPALLPNERKNFSSNAMKIIRD